MAIESAKVALKRVMTDEEFAAKLDELRGDQKALDVFMQAEGYDFTEEEFMTLVKDDIPKDQMLAYGRGQTEELPDELLEMVSGGTAGMQNAFDIDMELDDPAMIAAWSGVTGVFLIGVAAAVAAAF
jgi:predicted ribosomally synthesized peptide with nif11-like leader